MAQDLTYELQLKIDSVNKTLSQLSSVLKSFENTTESIGKNAGSKLGNGITSGLDGIGARISRIFDFTIGNVLANQLQNVTSSITNFVSGSIDEFENYKKAVTTLEIVSPKFGISAEKAKQTATDLSKELKLGLGTTAESLQNLFKSGLNLEQSTDLLKRFKNEAITGKSANISLEDAVKNLSFAYQTQNSAIGNLSGISENFSNIQENGLKTLQKQGQLLGKTVGKLNDAEKAQAQYAGIIELTNLTLGSSEKFLGSYTDNQNILNNSLKEGQRILGEKITPFINDLIISLIPLVEQLKTTIATTDFTPVFEALTTFGNEVKNLFDFIRNNETVLTVLRNSLISLAVILGSLALINIATTLTIPASIIGGIVALNTAFISLRDNVGTLPTVFQPVIDVFFNFIDYLNQGNILITFFIQIWNTLSSAFTTALPFIGLIIAQLGFLAIQIAVNSQYIFTQLYPAFLQIVTAIGNVIEALSPLINLLIQVSGVILNVLLGAFNLAFPIIVGIITQTARAFATIFSGIINVLSGVINFITGVFVGIFTGNFSKIQQGASQLLQGLGQIFGGLFDLLTAPVRGALDGVRNLFTSFNLFQIGVNLIQGLINGVKSMTSSLINSVTGAINGAIDGAKKILGINSPSKVFMEFGKFTGQGFVNGLENMEKKIGNMVDSVFSFDQLSNPAPVYTNSNNSNLVNNTTNNTNNQRIVNNYSQSLNGFNQSIYNLGY